MADKWESPHINFEFTEILKGIQQFQGSYSQRYEIFNFKSTNPPIGITKMKEFILFASQFSSIIKSRYFKRCTSNIKQINFRACKPSLTWKQQIKLLICNMHFLVSRIQQHNTSRLKESKKLSRNLQAYLNFVKHSWVCSPSSYGIEIGPNIFDSPFHPVFLREGG